MTPKAVLRRCIAEETIYLKPGTPVMLLYNINDKLVNGSTGTFLGLKDGHPIVNFEIYGPVELSTKTWNFYDANNPQKVVAKRTQFPLKSCWGVTVHKAQGQSLQAITVVSGNEFAPGQLYVACSRVFSKSGLQLKGFDMEKLIKPPSKVVEFMEQVKTGVDQLDFLNDCSCCRIKKCETADLEDLSFLEFVDLSEWDSTFEPTSNVVVPNVENEIQNLDSGTATNEEEIDLESILSGMDTDHVIDFPQTFDVSKFLEMVKGNAEIDAEWDSHLATAQKENDLLEDCRTNANFLPFLKVQWHLMASSLKDKVTENDLYAQHELLSAPMFSVLLQVMKSWISFQHSWV